MSEQLIVLTADDVKKSPDKVIDIIANLARRVSSLETQLRDTQGNVEKLAQELAKANYGITSLTCDVIALDDRTQVINAIAKFYEEANR
jgi:septal ring factor EnvC (AmiA/AmiB activator)